MEAQSVLDQPQGKKAWRFLRHLLEMIVVMMLGMCVLGAAWGAIASAARSRCAHGHVCGPASSRAGAAERRFPSRAPRGRRLPRLRTVGARHADRVR